MVMRLELDNNIKQNILIRKIVVRHICIDLVDYNKNSFLFLYWSWYCNSASRVETLKKKKPWRMKKNIFHRGSLSSLNTVFGHSLGGWRLKYLNLNKK